MQVMEQSIYSYSEWAVIFQFVIIYVPNQEVQGRLHTEHSVDTRNYIVNNNCNVL
jgi:hypothetical protein